MPSAFAVRECVLRNLIINTYFSTNKNTIQQARGILIKFNLSINLATIGKLCKISPNLLHSLENSNVKLIIANRSEKRVFKFSHFHIYFPLHRTNFRHKYRRITSYLPFAQFQNRFFFPAAMLNSHIPSPNPASLRIVSCSETNATISIETPA